jgi:hypothetical protein
MREFWNERYSSEPYVYGVEPNEFFRERIATTTPGRMWLPGEGEGRNAVHAAERGWSVHAADWSDAARDKALKLARERGVEIRYDVADLDDARPPRESYDFIGLFFLHLDDARRADLHRKAIEALAPGGTVALEAFEIDQLAEGTGGPKSAELLYSLRDLAEDFVDLDFLHFEKTRTTLREGDGHAGEAVVVRFVGRKSAEAISETPRLSSV